MTAPSTGLPQPASQAETVITASAVVVHPEGVVLDELGRPVLDAAGAPVFEEST